MSCKRNQNVCSTSSCSVKIFKSKEKEKCKMNIIDKKKNKNNHNSVYLSNSTNNSENIKNEENQNLLADGNKPSSRKISTTTILGETRFTGFSKNLSCITYQLKFNLLILNILGFFPLQPKVPRLMRASKRKKDILFLLITIIFISLNIYVLRGNINLALTFLNRFGLFYSLTASIIITGIKPLINIIYMIIFIERSKRHIDMLKKMDDLDISFRSAFKVTPNVKPYKIVFILAILITIIVTTTLRVIEHASAQQGTYYFSKQFIFSLVVIPLLSIWNLIPLLYYEICNRLIRFWCRHLSEHIEKETQSRKFTIRFYYEQFLKITKLQRSVGNTFNPFIFFCLAWSLILLCFTIYLSTEKIDNLVEPLPDLLRRNVSEEISRRILTQRVIFTLLWTSVQVVLSLLNIFVICATGMKTNEQTRKIVNAILGIVPIIETDSDRFQVQCFIHKMQTQYIWGMNVWRTVPLERTTFFTIVSVIVTYSVLLFKLHESRHISPALQKGINITQS